MGFQIDTLLEHLGKPGKYQLMIFALLAFNYFPIVFNIVIMAFYGGTPAHTCIHNDYENARIMENRSSITNESVVMSKLGKCYSTYYLKGSKNTTVSCETDPNTKWMYIKGERESTIVTEWNLVCEYKYLSKLATTIYFCGVMVGGLLFGYLADKYGRKPVMLVTLYIPILVGLGIAFSNNYYLFVSLRFMQGMFMQGLQTSTYVLAMEIFLPRYRGMAGAMLEVYWGISVVLVAPAAYLIQNWRYIQLAITLPSVLAIGYIWWIPESLRWLALQGKSDSVEALVQKISKFNALPYPSQQMESIQATNKTETKPTKHSFFDLLHTPQMRKRSLILFYLWFAVAVGYYTLLFNMTGLEGDKYLNFLISALVDLVAFILVLFIVRRCARRKPLLVFFMISGIFCMVAGIIPFVWTSPDDEYMRKKVITGCAIVGKFGVSGVFSLTFLYTSELYPTVIRNIGMGSCAFWARVGGVVAPQILALGDLSHKSTSVIVVGVICIIASVLLLLLPETMGTKLPDTIQEIEGQCKEEEINLGEQQTPMIPSENQEPAM